MPMAFRLMRLDHFATARSSVVSMLRRKDSSSLTTGQALIDFENVVFLGSPFGARIHPEVGGDKILIRLKDLFFVPPFGYQPFLFTNLDGHVNIFDPAKGGLWHSSSTILRNSKHSCAVRSTSTPLLTLTDENLAVHILLHLPCRQHGYKSGLFSLIPLSVA